MSDVFAIADRFVEEQVAMSPMTAIQLGQPADRLDDFSPAAAERYADLMQRTLAALDEAVVSDENDRIAAAVMRERISVWMSAHEAHDYEVDINVLASPAQGIRMVFDLLPLETDEQRATWLKLAADVPNSLESWKSSLSAGMANGRVAARRQAMEVAQQCALFGQYFVDTATPMGEASVGTRAKAAFDEISAWLRDTYASACAESDGVGLERYSREVRKFTGASIDVLELWHWGWAELDRITDRMEIAAEKLYPGVPLSEVLSRLDSDERYLVHGTDEIVKFLEDLTARATEDMKAHFKIPDEIVECQVKLAGEGSAAAPYYMPPSEDLSRPGSTWLPTLGKSEFATWHLVSTWYHEAVPGHHLQIATTVINRDKLSRFQRTLGWTSGYGEGWALYAERLMDELGYFEDPGLELGFLSAQALRACRIVVDIGMHLDLVVPDTQSRETVGTKIDYEFSVDFLTRRALQPTEFAQSETVRYLGWPGQAISYKLGEKFMLEARAEAKARKGSDFDLAAWHFSLLDLGPVGLDLMAEELAKI